MRADRGTGRMNGGTAAAPLWVTAAVLTAAVALGAVATLAMSGTRGPAATPATAQGPDAVPTRADLEEARVDVARLEAEQALVRSRKPWVVIDIRRAPSVTACWGWISATFRSPTSPPTSSPARPTAAG